MDVATVSNKKIGTLAKEVFWGIIVPFFFLGYAIATNSVNAMIAEVVYLITIFGLYDYHEYIHKEESESGMIYIGITLHIVTLTVYMTVR